MIFFEAKAALDRFKEDRFEMSAGLSAVAAGSGTSKDAEYADGVAVFTQAKKGLIWPKRSVGGQKFKFRATRRSFRSPTGRRRCEVDPGRVRIGARRAATSGTCQDERPGAPFFRLVEPEGGAEVRHANSKPR